MNKELIELQRGCPATSVVILDEYYKKLEQAYAMNADVSDNLLYGDMQIKPIFKEELEKKSSNGNITYLIIRKIDEISKEMQNRYVGLVKDRELNGYNMPDNVIIVFTISTIKGLENIAKELYHFCTVCI